MSNVECRALKNQTEALFKGFRSAKRTLSMKFFAKHLITEDLHHMSDDESNVDKFLNNLIAALIARVELDHDAYKHIIGIIESTHSLDYLANNLEKEIERLQEESERKEEESSKATACRLQRDCESKVSVWKSHAGSMKSIGKETAGNGSALERQECSEHREVSSTSSLEAAALKLPTGKQSLQRTYEGDSYHQDEVSSDENQEDRQMANSRSDDSETYETAPNSPKLPCCHNCITLKKEKEDLEQELVTVLTENATLQNEVSAQKLKIEQLENQLQLEKFRIEHLDYHFSEAQTTIRMERNEKRDARDEVDKRREEKETLQKQKVEHIRVCPVMPSPEHNASSLIDMHNSEIQLPNPYLPIHTSDLDFSRPSYYRSLEEPRKK